MRNVTNFDDCNVLFREVFGELDKLRSQDIDMQKRRVVNASPSQKTYDYVVRKELLDIIGKGGGTESVTQTTTSGGLYGIVFTTAGTAKTGVYVSGPYIFKRRSVSVVSCVSAITPPSSGDATFNLAHNGVAILNNDITLPTTAASLEVVSSIDFVSGSITFEVDDTLVLNVTNGGGASKVTVELIVREL